MSIRDQKLLYHFTALDSFESIVRHGLLSRADLSELGINFIDTADHNILQERETRLQLSTYIPFHFHIHTPYDFAVRNSHPNNNFIYLCLLREYGLNNGFSILPYHPASNEHPQILDYQHGFEAIDWETMEMSKAQARDKGIDERYHRQVRMAECLSPRCVPIAAFQSIVVKNDDDQAIIQEVLNSYGINGIYVDVKPYYF